MNKNDNKTVKNKNTTKKEQKNTVERQKRTRKKIYIGYTTRIIFNIIIFLLLLISGTFLLNYSLIYESEETIKYDEKSNLDYKVYLFENDFYQEEYLGKDMLYVASLIDKIELDFDYILSVEDNENINFDYSIVGKLSITNKEKTRSYYERTYTLLDNKKISMENTNHQNIKENIKIDYTYYNSLANNFKSSYGIDAESNLTVYMVINKRNGLDSNFKLDNSSIMNVVIPLSERSVEIKLDYQEINSSNTIVKEKGISIANVIAFAISIVLILISITIAIKIIRKLSLLHTKKSAYDKYIEKTLKEYDRLIAETTTLMPFEGKEIIKVNKFTELLDIHDNLQLPIIYYSIVKHHSSYFYINHNNTIYLMTVKAIDLEESK